MANHKLNPPPPVEVLKEDLVKLILDLGMIYNSNQPGSKVTPLRSREPGNQTASRHMSQEYSKSFSILQFRISTLTP